MLIYISVLPDANTDTFAASLLTSYCSFSSLILSSIVMIALYMLPKRLCLKCKGLRDKIVV